jgi:two-component system LytT family response regulator
MTASEFTVLIADDEPAARRGVRQLLSAFPAFRVAGECRNGSDVLASLDTLRPDLLFLDIQMPGLDGFEVIRQRTPERMPVVVFLTAYEQHALRAFDAQATDYLVKPVSEARFAMTMTRVTRLLGHGASAAGPRGGIVVTTARGARVIDLDDIDWIESADNYARLWVGARGYLLRESLDSLEQRVSPHGFARAHRQALVRIGSVRELVKGPRESLVAVLASGARIPVSRRKRARFTGAIRS